MNLERADLLLFANLAFVWIVANYFPLGEIDGGAIHRRVVKIVRVVAVIVLAGTIAGWRDAWACAVVLGAVSAAMLVLRERVPAIWLAEIELLNVFVLGGMLIVVRVLKLSIQTAFPVRCAANVVPAGLLIAAVICYALRGGNYIVRGLLEKGALIPAAPPASNDQKRVQHGRLIGYLERIIVIAAVAAGSFEALAFLMAAKGLIRAKELEDRPFAEYFLVGSLCSALVALLAGMLVSLLVSTVAKDAWTSLLL